MSVELQRMKWVVINDMYDYGDESGIEIHTHTQYLGVRNTVHH